MAYARTSFIQGIALFTGAASLSGLGCGSEVDISQNDKYVHGTIINTYIVEDKELTAAPKNVTIEALVQDPGGGFKSFLAKINSDGSFVIPNLTPGTPYYLRVEEVGSAFTPYPIYYITSAGTLDLGSYMSGRPDTAPITKAPTDIAFNLSLLNPTKESDRFAIYSQGAGANGNLYFPSMTLNTTDLKDVANDAFSTFFPPVLIDGSKGDTAVITQQLRHIIGDVRYRSVFKASRPAPFTMVDGQSTLITGSFEDVAQSTLKLDWKRSAFAGLKADVHPSAAIRDSDIYVYAEPGGSSRSTRTLSPTLIEFYETDPITTDVAADLQYANPFPSGWDLVGASKMLYHLNVTVPGADSETELIARIGCVSLVGGSGSLSVAPTISPVKDLKVNGMSTAGALTAVGTSPTVSFSPPDLGTPGYYSVDIQMLDPELYTVTIASFRTTETNVTIPEGVLEAGSFYYVRVTAREGKIDLSKPWRSNNLGCYAQALSNTITP